MYKPKQNISINLTKHLPLERLQELCKQTGLDFSFSHDITITHVICKGTVYWRPKSNQRIYNNLISKSRFVPKVKTPNENGEMIDVSEEENVNFAKNEVAAHILDELGLAPKPEEFEKMHTTSPNMEPEQNNANNENNSNNSEYNKNIDMLAGAAKRLIPDNTNTELGNVMKTAIDVLTEGMKNV